MIKDIYGLFVDEIAWEFEKIGIEKFRAAQVADWMYKRFATDFSQMTNLSSPMRSIFRERFCIDIPEEQDVKQSADGKTTKYLLRYSDGAAVETVLMRKQLQNCTNELK